MVAIAMTSATVETSVIGDPANSQGFKNGSGVLLTAGDVIWSAYTTNDTTAPTNQAPIQLNGRDFLTFRNLRVIGGNTFPSCVNGNTSNSTDIKFEDCAFWQARNAQIMGLTAAAGVSMNWTMERCVFVSPQTASAAGGTINVTLNRHTADYDANITIRNCLILGGGPGRGVQISSTGSGTGFGGGVDIINCTILFCPSACVLTGDANLSTTYPVTVQNCLLMGNVGLNANTSGQIVEDHNLIQAGTARTNVSAGTGSVSDGSYALLFDMGYRQMIGARPRLFWEPIAGSPLLGFGGSSPPSVDLLNKPRPAGGASASAAVGALERGNSFGKETSTVRTGSNAISITGPGYQDFELPVDAASTTVTVYVRWDATYAGTKPKMQVLNGSECGVSDATATATGSSGSWEQLSLNFTPTAAGIVTIRLLSSDTNGGGKMFADDFAVA